MGFPRLLCGNELIAVEERRTGGKLDAEGIEAIEEMRRLTIFLDYLTSPTPCFRLPPKK